jgi:hypothetical protein
MNSNADDSGSENPNLSDELQSFAAELARLRPRDDRLDRERLAFLAGQASVAPAPSKPSKALGLPLEGRAWPAAFAAMTAIAATLLCLLVARPTVPGGLSIAIDARGPDRQLASIEQVGGRAVLTTGDIHMTNIETRLAKLDANHSADGTSASPVDDFTRPVFTPGAWQQVIHETESAKPLPHKSSSSPHFQGVNT